MLYSFSSFSTASRLGHVTRNAFRSTPLNAPALAETALAAAKYVLKKPPYTPSPATIGSAWNVFYHKDQ